MSEPKQALKHAAEQAEKSALPIPIKRKSPRTRGRAHTILGLPDLLARQRILASTPHRRRLEEDLETLTAEEQWIAQGQQKALSHLHTLEELESPLADETERREKAEDKLPVRWIPVRERVGIPLLNFKSRTFVTFAFSCYFVRFPKHGLVLGWLPGSELPDRVDEEASTELE